MEAGCHREGFDRRGCAALNALAAVPRRSPADRQVRCSLEGDEVCPGDRGHESLVPGGGNLLVLADREEYAEASLRPIQRAAT